MYQAFGYKSPICSGNHCVPWSSEGKSVAACISTALSSGRTPGTTCIIKTSQFLSSCLEGIEICKTTFGQILYCVCYLLGQPSHLLPQLLPIALLHPAVAAAAAAPAPSPDPDIAPAAASAPAPSPAPVWIVS